MTNFHYRLPPVHYLLNPRITPTDVLYAADADDFRRGFQERGLVVPNLRDTEAARKARYRAHGASSHESRRQARMAAARRARRAS